MRHLVEVFSQARRSKERTRSGDVYYYTEHLRLVVREEPRVSIVMTVLPRWSETAPTEEEVDLAVEITRSIELAREKDRERLSSSDSGKGGRQQKHVLSLQQRARQLREALAEANRQLHNRPSGRKAYSRLEAQAKRSQEDVERMREVIRPLLALALLEEATNEDAAEAIRVVGSLAPELLSVQFLGVDTDPLSQRACEVLRHRDATIPTESS